MCPPLSDSFSFLLSWLVKLASIPGEIRVSFITVHLAQDLTVGALQLSMCVVAAIKSCSDSDEMAQMQMAVND